MANVENEFEFIKKHKSGVVLSKHSEIGKSLWNFQIEGNTEVSSLQLKYSSFSTLIITGFCNGDLTFNATTIQNQSGKRLPFFIELDQQGKVLNFRLLDQASISSSTPWSTLKTQIDQDGNLYYCFEQTNHFILKKQNRKGELLWTNRYEMDSPKLDQLFLDFSTNSVYVAISNGYKSETPVSNELKGTDFKMEIKAEEFHQSILLKINSNGATEYNKAFAISNSLEKASSILSLKKSPFGKLIVYGTTTGPSVFENEIKETAFDSVPQSNSLLQFDYLLFLNESGDIDKYAHFNVNATADIKWKMNSMDIDRLGNIYIYVLDGDFREFIQPTPTLEDGNIVKLNPDLSLNQVFNTNVKNKNVSHRLKIHGNNFLSFTSSTLSQLYTNSSGLIRIDDLEWLSDLYILESSCAYQDVQSKDELEIAFDPFNETVSIICHPQYDLIEIFDMNGKLVCFGRNTSTLSLQGNKTGNYLIKVIHDAEIYSKKFFKP